MSQLETSKTQILNQLRGLCAHCARGRVHRCAIQRIAAQVKAIQGVPLIVDNQFQGVVMVKSW